MKRYYYTFMILLLVASSAKATTHTITLANYSFTPKTLNVSIGDTIIWSGDFGGHTLKTTSVPSGATPIDFETTDGLPPGGLSYMYVAQVAGNYAYICTLHASLGMSGSFSVAEAGVEIPQQTAMVMDPIYPDPAQNMAMVHFTLEKPAHVTLRIYNAAGTLVQTPTDENMESGFHMLMIDTKSFASGSYQYVLQAGDAVLQRQSLVVK